MAGGYLPGAQNTCKTSIASGGPRWSIIQVVITAVKEIYKQSPDTYLDEWVWWVAIHHDVVISGSAREENIYTRLQLMWASCCPR